MTFSIIAYDLETGSVGAAAASYFPGVGGLIFGRSNSGSVFAMQSHISGALRRNLAHMPSCMCDHLKCSMMTNVSRPEIRQWHAINLFGLSICFSGEQCVPVVACKQRDFVSVAGNMLSSSVVVDAALDIVSASSDLPIATRLLAAMHAGQVAGGDGRGEMSAALVVWRQDGTKIVDFRVDDSPRAISELSAIYVSRSEQYERFVTGRIAQPGGLYHGRTSQH